MSAVDGRTVLIAGGGVAGLAAARALARMGRSSLVLERQAAHGDAGLAINLPGNAISALTALGLQEKLVECGRPTVRREYRTAADRVLFAIDEDAFWGRSARPRIMRRSQLLHLLGSDVPTDALRMRAEVTTIRQDQNGVAVELSDGSTLSGDVIVGADGVRSAVRRAATDANPSADALLAAASWRFMAPNPGVDCWTLWAGERSMILLVPVDNDEVYGWAAATDRKSARHDAAEMRTLFEGFPRRVTATVDAALADPRSVHHSPLQEVRPTCWGKDRIVLIGDAAHALAPVWAQGAALAMEDALALADVMAEQPDWSRLGVELQRRRQGTVDHVRRMTDRMSRAALLPIWLRDRLLPLVGPKSYRKTYGPLRTQV